MSRNGSGVYSLPAGNPVVTGTTISSSWANTTLSDIATALTGSIAADGQTAMTGNLQMGNNKVTGLAVATATGDALSYNQAATVTTLTTTGNVTIGGTLTLTGGLTLNGNVTVGDSSSDTLTVNATSTFAAGATFSSTLTANGAATFSSTFAANGGTTLGDASGDALTINSSAVSIPNGLNFDSNTLVIDATNNRVGVGTASPSYKLQVTDFAYVTGAGGKAWQALDTTASVAVGFGVNSTGGYMFTSQAVPLFFSTSGLERMRITSAGNVGIGTSSPSQRLDVNGNANITGGQLILNADSANYLYFKNASKLVFSNTVGNERMVIDSSGNLGLGVTPSAWRETFVRALQVGDTGVSFSAGTVALSTDQYMDICNNGYKNSAGDWIYTRSKPSIRYEGFNNQHRWYNAPSGTAGNAITFTQAMTLDASGNLGIGINSPAAGYKLHVAGDVRITNAGSETGALQISQESTQALIQTRYNQPLLFGTGTIERMRIDSSGNLLVGTTTNSSNSKINCSWSTANAWQFNLTNTASSGDLNGFLTTWTSSAPNNTTSYFYYGSDSASARFYVRGNGGIGNFSGNNVNLSDRREKTNFAPAGNYLSKICAIPVQTFNYIDQNIQEDDGLTLGVVAQDVQAVAPELVMESDWSSEKNGSKMRLSIYQTDLQYALMKCIQEQQAIINDLKARIETLESK
jgi:hypothetical protein